MLNQKQLDDLKDAANTVLVYIERIRRDRGSGKAHEHFDSLSAGGHRLEYVLSTIEDLKQEKERDD